MKPTSAPTVQPEKSYVLLFNFALWYKYSVPTPTNKNLSACSLKPAFAEKPTSKEDAESL